MNNNHSDEPVDRILLRVALPLYEYDGRREVEFCVVSAGFGTGYKHIGRLSIYEWALLIFVTLSLFVCLLK
jgi:hypothetical protein